jgi:chloride channel protein, CIC family
LLMRDNIYSAVLRQMGLSVGTRGDLTLLRRMTVADVPLKPAVLLYPADPAQRLVDLAREFAVTDYPVGDGQQRYVGMVLGDDIGTTILQAEAVPLMIVAELVRTDLPTVTREETLDRVLEKFALHEVSSLAVVDAEQRVTGLVTRHRLMRQYHLALGEGA